MKKKLFISLLLIVGMLLSSCSSTGTDNPAGNTDTTSPTATPEEADDFDVALRFVVASDIHITYSTDVEAERFAQMFEAAYAYAGTQEHSTVDAMVLTGDLTELGYNYEFAAFDSVVQKHLREETTFIPVLGNHDLPYEKGVPFFELYGDGDKHVVVDGYHFIGISPVESEDYSGSIIWLEEEVKAAAEADPDKPIITFQHHAISDTVYPGGGTTYSADLDSIFSQYSQIINFSGHSHAPINNPASVYQDDYTMFTSGSFKDGDGGPCSDQMGQFYIVEVSIDNSVRVMPYNLITGDFFKTDDGSKQLIYTIDDLKDPTTWLYTDEREANSSAPVFADDASVSTVMSYSNAVEIKVTRATDDECVLEYNITCKPEKGAVKQYEFSSQYYLETTDKDIAFTLYGLAADTEYEVTVVPEDVFGNTGAALTGTVKTSAEATEYVSEYDVNFEGTFNNFDSLENVTMSYSNPTYGKEADGDVFIGSPGATANDPTDGCEIVTGGYEGSSALAIRSDTKDERDTFIFARPDNGSTTAFTETDYLRVWVDFTNVDLFYGAFGLVSPTGELYTSKNNENADGQEFMYLAEGSDEWVTLNYGDDGCFGFKQKVSVKDFKGWLAFPVEDFVFVNTDEDEEDTNDISYPVNEVAGIYFYWDYDAKTAVNTNIILDEIQIVGDYTVFTEYNG